MRQLKMVELGAQYQRLKPDIDSAIAEVLNSTQFIKGPQVSVFEKNLATYLGAGDVISCANGTDALQLALMALRLQPGDEVITTSFTYVATAEVIALLQLTPVLVEVDPDTFTMDASRLEEAITNKTKAIVPVHLFGQCAPMQPILEIARKHNLFVIEDNAQAIGAEYRFNDGTVSKSGTMGNVGCTSFFPSKNLGCFGDGGALYTNDKHLAEKIRRIANHGQSTQYIHDEVGVNSRLDTLQAAILDVKLKHLDDFIARRQKVASFYDNAFSGIENVNIPVRAADSTHVFHQYTLKLRGIDRNKLREKLNEAGIPSMVYYPIPLHKQKAYANGRYSATRFPITEELCQTVLSLPIHTEFENEELEFIADHFIKYIKHN